MPAPAVKREIDQHLLKAGVRFTKGRRVLVEALLAADGPRSAAELHAAIGPRVPISSLYRSLAVLEECDVIVPHFGTKGITRYELAEWLAGHHHHVICVGCGAVEDMDVPAEQETEVRRVVDRISEFIGFEATGHTLEIEGRCVRCR